MPTSLSILFVDDEPDILSSMGRILRREGYTVDTVTSMAEAMDRDNWPDYFAILLDRKLPDGMSDEYVHAIRQLAPQAAIIFITGYADLESVLASLRKGVEDYLLKPIEPEAVLHRLRRVREMQKAEERALQSERLAAIGQTMAAIAHESRNALQRIQAGAEMLEMEVGDQPEARIEIGRIVAAADSIRMLLDEVREFAAPIKLDIARCNIARVWQRAWQDVTHVQPDLAVDFEENTNGTDLECAIDSERVKQVFRNLFDNGLAACSGRAHITVRCSDSHIDDVQAVQIAISDNGTGFANEHLDNVFEPFFTTKSKGTGLGMAIVKRIVEAHGGRITIGAHRNPGAEVIVTLPRNPR